VTPPRNGTIAIDPVTGEVTYTPDAGFSGTDTFEYSVCDDDGDCGTAMVTVTVNETDCTLVFNEFSPNGDPYNQYLVIKCIENYPNNKLEIYNRWGNLVYSKRGYNNDFEGISNGRAVVEQDKELPVGTYYYILEFGDGVTKPKVGWIYLNR